MGKLVSRTAGSSQRLRRHNGMFRVVGYHSPSEEEAAAFNAGDHSPLTFPRQPFKGQSNRVANRRSQQAACHGAFNVEIIFHGAVLRG